MHLCALRWLAFLYFSDSRVPAEFVFDQGLGDLFVIRVAGHIVAPSQIGSIEFAASRFGTRLVVVLDPFAVWSDSCDIGRTPIADRKSITESSIDR